MTDTRRRRPADPRLRAQTWFVLAGFAIVGGVDQLTKAWAWRHLDHTHINSGGDFLVSGSISSWYRNPGLGAAIDVGDAVVLAGLVLLLARRRRPPLLLGFGTLALAGWTSNLADRLGLHYLTGPGSVRGVVDFLPWRGRFWNVADIAIVIGTGGFAVSLLGIGLAAASHPRRRRRPAAVRRPLSGASGRLAVGFGLTVTTLLAAVGAVAYSGVSSPALFAAGR